MNRFHCRGSSHGHFRVFRKAYFEHPDYVPLLHAAQTLWRELESESKRKLYHQIGVVLSGPPDGAAVAGTLSAANEHSLPVERMDATEARRRWANAHFFRTKHRGGFWTADAGILAVEECVAQHLELAQQHGAHTRFHERVCGVGNLNQPASVSQHRKTEYSAATVVVAGGAWSAGMLATVLPPLSVLKKIQAWHPVAPDFRTHLADMPAFFFETSEGAFYGMPSGSREIKLARHSGGELVRDPGQSRRRCFRRRRTGLC